MPLTARSIVGIATDLRCVLSIGEDEGSLIGSGKYKFSIIYI